MPDRCKFIFLTPCPLSHLVVVLSPGYCSQVSSKPYSHMNVAVLQRKKRFQPVPINGKTDILGGPHFSIVNVFTVYNLCWNFNRTTY